MTAKDTVLAYLRATQQRDLALARRYLAPDFTMEFPGGAHFTQLEQLIEWAQSRYRKVDKQYEQFDVIETDEKSIVYCYGTLFGEWLDGRPFADIRFIDRFSVIGNRLTDQKVWNDLAESRRRAP